MKNIRCVLLLSVLLTLGLTSCGDSAETPKSVSPAPEIAADSVANAATDTVSKVVDTPVKTAKTKTKKKGAGKKAKK